jgi:prevent-host-death family protein
MARKVTATEAKATILALLDDVGVGDEVEITKRGRTVARLADHRSARAQGKPCRRGDDRA